MPAKQYPFIDIAVHERVRDHFANGEAAILFSADMKQVLWANGQGAALFGHDAIYDLIDAGADRSDVSFRQLHATATQLRQVGERRNFLMRIASGFRSATVNALVEIIRVRAGDTAILFTAPLNGKATALNERAERMLSGFDDPDTHMAVLDGDGQIVAASDGFRALGISEQTRRMLVGAVSIDSDWLVKRPIATGKGHLPAAIGKLSDAPALHLLFAVETILGNLDPDPADAARDESVPDEPVAAETDHADIVLLTESDAADASVPETVGEQGHADAVPVEAEEAAGPEEPNADAPDAPLTSSEDALLDVAMDGERDDAIEPEEIVAEPEEPAETTSVDVTEAGLDTDAIEDSADSATDETGAEIEREEAEISDDLDALVSETMDTIADDAEPIVAPVADIPQDAPHAEGGFRFDPAGRATRFVWKIDSTGHFSEISDEFAAAVGPHSADISGKNFSTVADRYGFDEDGKIRDLLKRRDTWSGKTILWPVEGTDLVVPVDLAALPTYSRNREFDGFRGFGIVRVSDATTDARAFGLSLVRPAFDIEAYDDPGAIDAEDADDVRDLEILDGVPDSEEPPETEVSEPTAGEPDNAPDTTETATDGEPAEPDDTAPEDIFRGERPVLRIVDPSFRSFSEKIVQLEERRNRSTEGLTNGEQAAFREIARQLGTVVGEQPDEADPVPDNQNIPLSEAPEDRASDDTVGQTKESVETPYVEHAQTPPLSADDAEIEMGEGVEFPDEATAETPQGDDTDSPVLLGPEVLDHMPVALLVHSGDVLHHANPEFLKLTGYSSLSELVNDGGIDALFVGDEEDMFDVPHGSLMMIRNDGHLIPVNARLQSVRWDGKTALMMSLALAHEALSVEPAADEDYAPVALTGVNDSDAVDALRIETDELRSILETATDGVVTIGTDGDIRSMNRSASALFNYDEAETRGKPFAILFAHESQKAVLDYLAGLAGHGVASVLNDGREVIGRESSGGFIPLFMTMGRLSSSSGYCAVIRDITQWKRTEEELRNAKRAAETANAHKTEFLARVSHEIRTPLNAIIGFSDMMASERLGPIGHSRYVEYAGDIGRSGRHVLDIVNDLLDISKIEAGEMDLEFTAVGLNEMVSEAVSLVQPQANAQRVIVRTSLSNAVPSVVADARSIKQIALNILANAIRFTQAGGQIVVSTAYEASGSVVLRIRDTGVGMSRAELEQALKPFRQVASGTRKQRGDGTGLGLPLTKAMVDANRALFSISSAPNEGTLVEVTFPSQRVLAD